MSAAEKTLHGSAECADMADFVAWANAGPAYDANGIDLSLIDLGLAMSVEERIEWHYRARLLAERMIQLGQDHRGPVRLTAEEASG